MRERDSCFASLLWQLKKKRGGNFWFFWGKFLCSSHQKWEHMPRCTSGHGRPTTRSSLGRYAQCNSEACVRPSKTTLARLTATRNTSDVMRRTKAERLARVRFLKITDLLQVFHILLILNILIILLFRLFKVIYVQKSLSERISPGKSPRWRLGGQISKRRSWSVRKIAKVEIWGPGFRWTESRWIKFFFHIYSWFDDVWCRKYVAKYDKNCCPTIVSISSYA